MARILVIDDSEGVQSFLGIILRSAGHDVQMAMNGKEGLEAHATHPADLIITDIFMPGMTGLETIRALRAQDAIVKIIAMSALPDQGNPLGSARRLGANEAVTKPFLPQEVLAVVQDVLNSTK
jgi:CheY-like chemotaxis protein